ncbi:ribbon-helix-helix protein, CopG family [Actinoalloteichus caeruleus]|uniref:Ribbon-helix-helix protein, copG family n=1 Tax=Actinoalloteichus caeruleus DSM 43889 TaxID=1120930 RepID=A0ABT1JP79_ACTCY|nr:ribbon-helix-helix protein, CopG family [Actinoalloteichus caeruleus]MCP2334326.1 Ribbon-helix-helix protein, copG family [Actinoalloteichus caeruleus DSM 43889]
MDLTTYVGQLGRELAALADAGGEESRALVERLTGPLESAIRMTLLDTLSAASDEITRELAPGSVEVRLRGRDPEFVVTPPPSDPLAGSAAGGTTTTEKVPPIPEDGPTTRINVRLPEPLKAAVEEAAAAEGRSVNSWLVRAAAAALRQPEGDPRSEHASRGTRGRQGFTGWVR